MIYEGKLKIGNQIIRFGGDSTEYVSDLSDLVVGVSTLAPANVDTTNNSEDTSEEDNTNNEEESAS